MEVTDNVWPVLVLLQTLPFAKAGPAGRLGGGGQLVGPRQSNYPQIRICPLISVTLFLKYPKIKTNKKLKKLKKIEISVWEVPSELWTARDSSLVPTFPKSLPAPMCVYFPGG